MGNMLLGRFFYTWVHAQFMLLVPRCCGRWYHRFRHEKLGFKVLTRLDENYSFNYKLDQRLHWHSDTENARGNSQRTYSTFPTWNACTWTLLSGCQSGWYGVGHIVPRVICTRFINPGFTDKTCEPASINWENLVSKRTGRNSKPQAESYHTSAETSKICGNPDPWAVTL